MTNRPSWRKIERALVELMQEYRLPLTADRGETFVEIDDVEYSVEQMARELEDRL